MSWHAARPALVWCEPVVRSAPSGLRQHVAARPGRVRSIPHQKSAMRLRDPSGDPARVATAEYAELPLRIYALTVARRASASQRRAHVPARAHTVCDRTPESGRSTITERTRASLNAIARVCCDADRGCATWRRALLPRTSAHVNMCRAVEAPGKTSRDTPAAPHRLSTTQSPRGSRSAVDGPASRRGSLSLATAHRHDHLAPSRDNSTGSDSVSYSPTQEQHSADSPWLAREARRSGAAL
jgi:hypothetical protein